MTQTDKNTPAIIYRKLLFDDELKQISAFEKKPLA
jgi:hypothetical protein